MVDMTFSEHPYCLNTQSHDFLGFQLFFAILQLVSYTFATKICSVYLVGLRNLDHKYAVNNITFIDELLK